MTKREIKFDMPARRQGKTLQMQEVTKAAIERGDNLYLAEAPSVADETCICGVPGCRCYPPRRKR